MSLSVRLLAVALAGIACLSTGAWLAARHYRPLLDAAQADAARCVEARNSLLLQVEEQNRRLEELALASKARESAAAQALQAAETEANGHEAKAMRLLSGHSEGDDCAVVAQLIDRELSFSRIPTNAR
ncbi:hypothetical protein [Pseudomonas citronellolis]|uniref:hypothetical protein n=1 Tax=Pseudomonas citronellolis TaxID=53408 RepID=UPI0023E39905|nr:hypothetical protein [Pseudomonas citronellolis]MDF3932299.1 hypothetical protein [Pseudomonas citronellolis]